MKKGTLSTIGNGQVGEEIYEVDKESVEFMDVSPKQVVSVATAMIPSWRTMTPTELLWVLTCSVRLFL